MPQPTVAIPLRAGKTRLADLLPAGAIASLRASMFADVVAAVRAANVERIVVVAGDETSAELARLAKLPHHVDPPRAAGLDDALQAAVIAADPTIVDLLVVQADLPALTANDVRALLYAAGEVVIAPTADGGTGGLLRRPVGIMSTAYGPESAARHAARALDAGVMPTVLKLPGFQLDVDTPEDLHRLGEVPNLGRATTEWVRGNAAALADDVIDLGDVPALD